MSGIDRCKLCEYSITPGNIAACRYEDCPQAKTPTAIEIIAGDTKMTITPATIERVIKGWEADNPGKSIEAMPSSEFADRCMNTLYENARLLETGKA